MIFNFSRPRLLPLLVAMVCAGGGGACEPASKGPERRDIQIKILCIAPAVDDATWPVFEACAQAFMARHRTVDIEVVAPATRSPAVQTELLRSARARQVQAVCIMPIDPLGIQSTSGEISTAGIPIVAVGRDIYGERRDSFCGPSETEIGRSAALACQLVLQHRSNTVMLLHAGDDDEVYGKRYHGFRLEAAYAGPIEILREVDCGGDRFEAVKLVKAESRRFPRIGCWVFLEDWPLRAISEDERLLPLGVTIVLCDASPRHWDRLRDGQIQALIGYDLQAAIENAFFRSMRLASGDSTRVEHEVTIPSEIITIKELSHLERRWEAWRMGQTSPPPPPQE